MNIGIKNNTVVAFDEDTGTIASVTQLRSSDKDVSVTLSDADVDFLREEFDLDMGSNRLLKCDAETANNLILMCFQIEAEETLKAHDSEMSERGETATRVINLIHGPYDARPLEEIVAAIS